MMLWLVRLAALFFVCAVWSFKYCDVWILGGEKVDHAVKGGRMGPFLGVVAEDNTRPTAGVCAHEANIEARIQ